VRWTSFVHARHRPGGQLQRLLCFQAPRSRLHSALFGHLGRDPNQTLVPTRISQHVCSPAIACGSAPQPSVQLPQTSGTNASNRLQREAPAPNHHDACSLLCASCLLGAGVIPPEVSQCHAVPSLANLKPGGRANVSDFISLTFSLSGHQQLMDTPPSIMLAQKASGTYGPSVEDQPSKSSALPQSRKRMQHGGYGRRKGYLRFGFYAWPRAIRMDTDIREDNPAF
jgi:hypothetical protein